MSDPLRRLIRQAMTDREVGVRELGRMTGVAAANISRYLNAKSDVNTETLLRLAAALDVRLGASKPSARRSAGLDRKPKAAR